MPPAFTADSLHLYVLTDSDAIGSRNLCDVVADAIAGGATLIQYREKHANRKTMYTNALRLRTLTRQRHVPLIINDFVDLALAVEADGVHVGQTDLPIEAVRAVVQDQLWIGVSTHSVEQASEAALQQPTYVAVGPVFPTLSKNNPDPVIGLEGVRAIRESIGTTMPLVAIGGIDAGTAKATREAGADGVSVISAAWTDDVVSACRALAS